MFKILRNTLKMSVRYVQNIAKLTLKMSVRYVQNIAKLTRKMCEMYSCVVFKQLVQTVTSVFVSAK
jgi:hypothetical protein